MPPMKIQPIDIDSQKLYDAAVARNDAVKPMTKTHSRLRRLLMFDRRNPSEKPAAAGEAPPSGRDIAAGVTATVTEFEPSSVCLAKMVQSYIEESNSEKQTSAKCGRNRCNCFNGNSNDSSDEELEVFGESVTNGSFGDANDTLKSLIPCASVAERNLLADTSNIVEKNSKVHKRKEELRKSVTESLQSLGYAASICKSKWEKTSAYPAGYYEYIDVIVDGERLLIDIDFRSEFEIARPTGTFKTILQSLPNIFVGKSDRLRQIVTAVSEAAKQSLKKKGMPLPPWRKAEYMLSKWLSSSCTRETTPPPSPPLSSVTILTECVCNGDCAAAENDSGALGLIFGEESLEEDAGEKSLLTWQPPPVRVKCVERGANVVTGLASLLRDRP